MKAYPYCVYTILSSATLNTAYKDGGKGSFTEDKNWAMACDLFVDSEERGQKLPIVFAAAEDTTELIYHAVVNRLHIDHSDPHHPTTTCWFIDLEPFNLPRPNKTSLIVKSTGQNIPHEHIRTYVICETPPFIS
jgi:hypothetical protein